jgi:dephospho-CoA kinase
MRGTWGVWQAERQHQVANLPFVVGLTGGIGAGKTTVTTRFANLGAAVVDTDEIAHALSQAGGRAIAPIRDAFGPSVLTAEGALNRVAMRELVFSEAGTDVGAQVGVQVGAKTGARALLESILHPMIREESMARVADIASQTSNTKVPYVILAVPLLFEAMSFRSLAARTLLVDCPVAVQIERVMRRSNLDREEAGRIVAAQIARPFRLQLADDLIENVASSEALDVPVGLLHARYLAFAADRSS